MYSVDDLVVYGIHGVCKIADIEEKSIGGKKVSYYMLVPENQMGANFYVPIHSTAAVAKLRPLLSKEELEDLLRSSEVRKDAWITDESKRKQRYKELIGSGERAAVLSMVRALHIQKDQQLAAGRKFHLCDENFLRDAEKLLSSEISRVLDLTPEEAIAHLRLSLRD